LNALELVARSGTVGAGGAGFPTHVKLAAKDVEVLIANAAECEPMLYTNQELLRHEAPAFVDGLLAAAQLVGAKRTVVAIKEKYHDAIVAVQAALATAGSPVVEIIRLPDYYPAGDEHAIVAEVTGRIVPENGLPLDVGVVVQNVETLANVSAALQGRPVTLKWVTVTGAVRQPISIPYRQGMTVLDAVLAAGGVNEFAAPDRSSLYRRAEGQTTSYAIRLDKIINRGDLSTNFNVAPGDVITVPERAF